MRKSGLTEEHIKGMEEHAAADGWRPLPKWPAPGMDDTDLSEPGPALELHRA